VLPQLSRLQLSTPSQLPAFLVGVTERISIESVMVVMLTLDLTSNSTAEELSYLPAAKRC